MSEVIGKGKGKRRNINDLENGEILLRIEKMLKGLPSERKCKVIKSLVTLYTDLDG